MRSLLNLMARSIKCFVSLFSLLLCSNLLANETCFSGIRLEPAFIALTTEHESKLDTWYQQVFGLEVVKRFSTANGDAKGVLMKNGELVVEVFKRKEPLVPERVKPSIPRAYWNGYLKVGVFTNADLEILKQCLVSRGVMASRIFDDEKLNVKLLHVTDPEDNSLEIITRKN